MIPGVQVHFERNNDHALISYEYDTQNAKIGQNG